MQPNNARPRFAGLPSLRSAPVSTGVRSVTQTWRVAIICLVTAIASACATQSKPYFRTVEKAAQYQNQRNFALAEKYHRQALKEMRADSEVSATNLSIQLANVASVLLQDRRTKEASALLSEALTIQENQPAENTRVLAQIYALLGRCEEFDGSIAAAEATYTKALDLALTIKDWPAQHYGFVMAGLANIYVQKGELDKADHYYRQAEKLFAAQSGANSVSWQQRAAEYQELSDAAAKRRVIAE